MLYVHSVVAL